MPYDFAPATKQYAAEAFVLGQVAEYLADCRHWNKGFMTGMRNFERTHCIAGAVAHFAADDAIFASTMMLLYRALPWYIPRFPNSNRATGWVQTFNDLPWTRHRSVMRVVKRAQARTV